MKTRKFYLTAALVLFFAGNIYSQNGWRPGSNYNNSNYNNMYDAKTVENISGSVINVEHVSLDKNMSDGIHLLLNTVNGNISVNLGPAWYIDNQDIQIIKGDNISITGSKVTYNGDQVIIAKEIIKGNQLLKLREDNGYPLWSGSGNIYSQNGWGRGSNYNNIYDAKTIEVISGMVISVDQISLDKNMSDGIHLLLNTVSGNISVNLGPSWFIDNQDIQIIRGDNISVTGSKVTYNGDQVIIAKEVIKGDQLLKLRDENGYPLWSGWRNNK